MAEVYGNDSIVSVASSNFDFSLYAIGPALFELWNETGANPPHVAGQIKAIFQSGSLLHEIGHTLSLCHNGPVPQQPTGQDVIFVGSDNGRLYKIDMTTFTVLASVDTRRPGCPADKIVATPAVQLYSKSNSTFQSDMAANGHAGDDLVIVATSSGCADVTANRVRAYFASDLAVKWTFNATGTTSMGDATFGAEVDYGNNRIYLATNPTAAGQSTLWAIGTVTSNPSPPIIWSHNAGSLSNRPILNYQNNAELYVVNLNGTITKLDPATGSTVWSLPSSSPIVRGLCPEFRTGQPTRLYYVTEDGALHGTMDNFPAPVALWPPVSPPPGVKFSTIPALAPGAGKMYLGRDDGMIQQIERSTGALETSGMAGRPRTLSDPTLSLSVPNATDPDRLTITTTEGSIRRYAIPWSTTAVATTPLVDEFALAQNVPNPFSTMTRIDYRLPYDARVEIDVFSVDGRRVRTLMRQRQQSGPQMVSWDGLDDAGLAVSSGSYFYRLRASASDGRSFERSKKVELVR
jgi:outer membrane protein assembly factor BamB